jgi:hypothetical protein
VGIMSDKKKASYVRIEEKDGELYLEGDIQAAERILKMLKEKPQVTPSPTLEKEIGEKLRVEEVEVKPLFFRILWRKRKEGT